MKTMRILLCLALISFLVLGCNLFNGGEEENNTVTDIDGNTYQTVEIGNQIWMAENLKTTHYRDGTAIPNVTDNTAWTELSTGAYCYYDNESDSAETYGYLYNWYAVNNAAGLAPKGWHVPTDKEWKELEMFLGMSQTDADSEDWRGIDERVGEKLKSTSGWLSDGNGTDEVGFAALPGGYRLSVNGFFDSMGFSADFWSASDAYASYAWRRSLSYFYATVHRYDNNKGNGFSVRCVKDYTPFNGGGEETGTMTVTTSSVTGVTATSATCGGNVTASGGLTVTARGVCWSTSSNPTISDNKTTDGSGTGSFTSEITGLSSGNTYYVRAYATNNAGTAYGESRSFTILLTGTVTDIDGNEYKTVKIGDQWWMAENLKTTKYRDGTVIPIEEDNAAWVGLTTGAYCYYDNSNIIYWESEFISTFGALYNWYAVNGDTDGDGTKDKEIAPEGWHVPTDAEWTTLTDYLGGASSAGEKLKSTSGWYRGRNGTDEVGFAALPGGYRSYPNGSFSHMGLFAYFWSASELTATNARLRVLVYDGATVSRHDYSKRYGYSVRCVKDAAP